MIDWGFVYVLYSKYYRLSKVGFTGDLEARQTQLTKRFDSLELHYAHGTVHKRDAVLIERHTHRVLRPFRFNNWLSLQIISRSREWYWCDPEHVADTLERQIERVEQ